jgi:hypothetical protein
MTMLLMNFERDTKRLMAWYKRKLDANQLDVMYNRVRHIPGPAYADIIDSIIEDSRYFPTIVEIKNRYFAWRAAHPEQAISYEKTLCLDCHGKGFIWYNIRSMDIVYNVVCRCGACENWKGQGDQNIPIKHRSNLERDGLEITFPKHRAKDEDDLRPRKTDRHREIVSKLVGSSATEKGGINDQQESAERGAGHH